MPDWLVKPFGQLFEALLSEYGPLFIVLIAGIVILFLKYDKSRSQLIAAKDSEIERLVEERNRYQHIVMGSRMSSGGDRMRRDQRREEEGEEQ